MNFRKLPIYLLFGVMIFPILIVLGVVLWLITWGGFNMLFWLIIPSVIFEELFETCCYFVADSQILNLVFALIFWFVIGVALSLIGKKLKYL